MFCYFVIILKMCFFQEINNFLNEFLFKITAGKKNTSFQFLKSRIFRILLQWILNEHMNAVLNDAFLYKHFLTFWNSTEKNNQMIPICLIWNISRQHSDIFTMNIKWKR